VAISDDARVMRHACAMLCALGAVGDASSRLVRANAIRAVCVLVGSDDKVRGGAALHTLAWGTGWWLALEPDWGRRLSPPLAPARFCPPTSCVQSDAQS
jgi:hypothetical protein